MTILRTLAFGAAAILLTGTAAQAQIDAPFDGVYAGINAGVDWTRLKGDGKYDRSISYGGFIGYRMQDDDGTVYGVEGSFGDDGYSNHKTGANTDYNWSVAGVFGRTIGYDDLTLLYGKAGYTRMRYGDGTTNVNDGGWLLGAGVERSLSDGLSVRTGLDYANYGAGVKSWQAKAALVLSY